jgi:hypothetical protein
VRSLTWSLPIKKDLMLMRRVVGPIAFAG